MIDTKSWRSPTCFLLNKKVKAIPQLDANMSNTVFNIWIAQLANEISQH